MGNKSVLNKYLKEVALLIIIRLSISLIWRYLEILITGSFQKDEVDSIIALILQISIYFNIKVIQVVSSVKIVKKER